MPRYTAHGQKQSFVAFNLARGGSDGLIDAITGGGEHLGVDAQFLAVIDFDAVFGGIGVENAGDVVLGVAGGEQHAGNSQNAGAAGGAQLVQTFADNRMGEFEITVFEGILRQALFQLFGQIGEFGDSALITAAMAAQHNTQFLGHLTLPSSGPGPRNGSAASGMCFRRVIAPAVGVV